MKPILKMVPLQKAVPHIVAAVPAVAVVADKPLGLVKSHTANTGHTKTRKVRFPNTKKKPLILNNKGFFYA